MISTEADRIARLGAVLAAPSRSALLYALMGGTAHTQRELARHTGLAASSVSEHVGVLLDAGLVRVEAQGRHRYVRLADDRVAELLEHVGVLAQVLPAPPPRVPAALSFARSCYGHLAGELGVRVHDALAAQGCVRAVDGTLAVTDAGHALLVRLGAPLRVSSTTALVRPCLDWSARRHHVAGRYGDALLAHFRREGWLRPHPTTPRALELGPDGRRCLARLGVDLP